MKYTIEKFDSRNSTPDWYENHRILNDFFIDGKKPVLEDYPEETFNSVMGAFDWYDDEHYRLTKELEDTRSWLESCPKVLELNKKLEEANLELKYWEHIPDEFAE